MTENTQRPWLSESILIAVVPAAATYLAYLYHWSYFAYYGIPPSLIEIDIPKIIFALVAIVLAALVFLMLFGLVARFVTAEHPIAQIFGKQLILVVFFLPLILASLSIFTRKQLISYTIIFLAIGASSYIPPKNKGEERLTYLDRLRRQNEQEDESDRSKPTTARAAIGNKVIAPLGFVMFLSLYVSMLGQYFAGARTAHMALRSQPDAIYVTKYQDKLVFVRYDKGTRTLKDQILFVSTSTDEPLELFEVQTGELLRPSR